MTNHSTLRTSIRAITRLGPRALRSVVQAWRRTGSFAPALMVMVVALALVSHLGLEQPKGANTTSTSKTIEAAVARPGGGGWSTNGAGDVFEFGSAPFFGSMAGHILSKAVVGIAATADGQGYWLTASDGGVFAFGDAGFYGSTGALHLNRPIVGMAATADAKGYWMVASDGGIFAFGDALFSGSRGGVAGFDAASIAAVGGGYWIVSTNNTWTAFGSTTSPSNSVPSSTPLPSVSPVGKSVLHVAGNVLEGASGSQLRLLGVDVSGTEDACIRNDGFSWGPLTASEAKDIASWHATAVRIPLNEDCWLGINGAPARFSGAAYQSAMKSWVADLNAAGLVAILDLHWSAPGSYRATQQWPMADADHSLAFWSQVASMFKSTPSVVFDLFNEPFVGRTNPTTADWSCWLNGCATSFACSRCSLPVTYQAVGMQQLLNTVRAAGATQPVMLGGLNWAGDPCGTTDLRGNGGICMWLHFKPSDPENQVIADFHTYSWTTCATTNCWNTSILPVATVVPVVTGEMGERDCSANYIDQYMSWADQHGVSYLAWSWEMPTSGTTGCSATNMQLLSDWNGTPSTTGAAGPAFASHLAKD